MANIIKRLARHCDDMRLANFQGVRGLDAEWKLLRCPTEYCLPNLTPLWANRNLSANRSDVVPVAKEPRLEVQVPYMAHLLGIASLVLGDVSDPDL